MMKILGTIKEIVFFDKDGNELHREESLMSYEQKLTEYAKHNLNVLITGTHGIGKSEIVKAIAEKTGLQFKYYSTSTLDPWADIVGIPKPVDEGGKKFLDFYRPRDIENAEFIFFDELNRAHPRVLQAVLEIIQFKSINGTPLPNLKMIWAAINPPGGAYQVEALDPALVDRFHLYFKMQAMIDVEYLSTVMDRELASTLRTWWNQDLSDDMRDLITPRRIEYIGRLITLSFEDENTNFGWYDAIPPSDKTEFTRKSLDRRIAVLRGEEEDFVLDQDNIIEHRDKLIKRLKVEPDCGIKIADQMTQFTDQQLFDCRDLLEALSKELVFKIGNLKFTQRQRVLKERFQDAEIDIKSYPKISYGFGFEDY